MVVSKVDTVVENRRSLQTEDISTLYLIVNSSLTFCLAKAVIGM